MTTIEQSIIDLVHRSSGGKVRLTQAIAAEIVNVVQTGKSAYVQRLKYSVMINGWEKPMTIQVTDEQIEEAMKIFSTRPKVENYYLYKCFNSKGEKVGEIHTIEGAVF